jgi:FtsH-binding integral membrane protein
VLLATGNPHRGRVVAALFAACWLWIGWAFHYERYAQINWVATWIGAAFALQAGLFVGVGVIGGRFGFDRPNGRTRLFAIALIAIVVVGYPLLAPLTGRAWASAEAFGVAPDPTALATVASLALARGRIRWLLLAVPLLWCVFTALTLRAMKSPEFFVVIAVAALALLPAIGRRRNGEAGAAR